MPDVQPPYLDPSQYPAYLDLQRKQMLAQALMGATQQNAQTPAEWNSMRVVPRRSALSNIATLATALGAGTVTKQAQKAQMDYFKGLMGGGPSQPTQTAAAAPSAPPSAPSPEPSAIAAQQTQQAPSPNQNMLLTGEPRTSQQLLTMMGPQEYAKALAGRYAPTDLEKLGRAAGLSEEQIQTMARLSLAKQTTNVENVRPGGTVFDLTQGKPIFSAPQNGQQVQYGPNGPTVAMLPGAPEAIAAQKGAETAGEVANKYSILPTQGGGTTVVGGPHTGLDNVPGRQAPRVSQPYAAPNAPAQKGFEGIPKLPVSSSLGAPDAFTHGRLQAAGAKDAELSSQYGKEADLADQKLQYNTDARKVLGTAEVGPSSEWLTENRSRLLEWGVPENLVPGSSSVTPTLELNKVLKQSALQGARQIFGSRMTQMEVRLQHEELSPSPAMTKDAILSLMKQDDIKQMYAKQRAEDYGKYIQDKGDPLRFESWYAKTHPLTQFAKQHEGDIPSSDVKGASQRVTKQIGGKTYYQENGKWFEQ